MNPSGLHVPASLSLIVVLSSGCHAEIEPLPPEPLPPTRPDASLALDDGGVPTAVAPEEDCQPASRTPVIGEDPFCPSFHDWLGAQPEPRVGLAEQCAHWEICEVPYVGDGRCYHCPDVSDTPE